MLNPFADVSSRYGSPMGRRDIDARLLPELLEEGLPVRVTHQHDAEGAIIEPAYDSGGAYWGLPDNVYAVHYGGACAYVRADSSEDALRLVADA